MPGRLLHIVAFLILLLAPCLAPGAAKAETVGLILTHEVYDYERIHDSLIASLKKQGYADRVRLLLQRPYPDPIALSNAARKLIAADVDVIITYGTAPTTAVLRERPRVPVLYAGVYEPMAASIKNKWTTGVCCKYNVSSLVRYLKSSKNINNLGIIFHSLESESMKQTEEIEQISGKYGFTVKKVDLKDRANLSEMLNSLDADALIVTSSLPANSSLPTILRISSDRKLPTASLISNDKVMAMITLVSDPEEQGRLLAGQLIDVLNGKLPENIAPVCGRKIELVYNVKDANQMGLKISMDLITEATTLINK